MQIPQKISSMYLWLAKKYRAELLRKKKISSNHNHAIDLGSHPNSCEMHCICLKAVASEFVSLDDNQQLWHFHKLRINKRSL